MATIVAVLLTLAYIKAGTARIINACLSKLGEDASYDNEGRAFVLTTLESDGSATWTGKSCGERDTVVRVYATAVTDTSFKVYIGHKVRGGRADRGTDKPVECSTVEAAELLITSTVFELSQGVYTGELTKRLPRAFHGRKFVERPDQVRGSRKGATVVTKVTDEATDAMRAMLAAAEAAEASKPADKPKTPEAAPKATK
jgi:hypothetical protein